ncbi:hypothetical protein Hanom_Chr10g00908261 [Helianthus anomalus]
MDKNAPTQKDKTTSFQHSKYGVFGFWTKMAIKVKPQGLRFKKFEIWTKMEKVPKPQGPKWKFTLPIKFTYILSLLNCFSCQVYLVV